MEKQKPTINIIILTYNRAHLVERAIQSVLRQTFQDFELILINNGSQDNTREVLSKYRDHEKVRYFDLEPNRGFAGGFNFGLEQIRSEWFTDLGDDDEIVPEAFETMLRVPQEIDPRINAVTCNGFDTALNSYSGTGLDRDQYLPIDVIIKKTGGDFWGITKTELIGDKRLNENIRGYENTFWYKIDAIAHRYYIHRQLKIYHTEHAVTESKAQNRPEVSAKAKLYASLLEEPFFWDVLRQYNPQEFMRRCLSAIFFLRLHGDKVSEREYGRLLMQSPLNWKTRIASSLIASTDPRLLRQAYRAYGKLLYA